MAQSKNKRVVVVDTGYESYAQEAEILGRSGYSLELFSGDRLDAAGKAAFARGAESRRHVAGGDSRGLSESG